MIIHFSIILYYLIRKYNFTRSLVDLQEYCIGYPISENIYCDNSPENIILKGYFLNRHFTLTIKHWGPKEIKSMLQENYLHILFRFEGVNRTKIVFSDDLYKHNC